MNRADKQTSGNPWLAVERFLDRGQARNPDFAGEGTLSATDGIGPQGLGNNEVMKEDFISEILNNYGDDQGPEEA